MSIIESLVVSLFCIALVFFVLAGLFILVNVLSKVLNKIGNKEIKAPVASLSPVIAPVTKTEIKNDVKAYSTGELKLFNVDEKTAAMVMAIVSDESQIPLSELCFKSIKAV